MIDSAFAASMVLGMLALKGVGVIAMVYVGARLAIRHEQRRDNLPW